MHILFLSFIMIAQEGENEGRARTANKGHKMKNATDGTFSFRKNENEYIITGEMGGNVWIVCKVYDNFNFDAKGLVEKMVNGLNGK